MKYQLIELIFVVTAQICIEKCIDMLNVFKVYYKGNSVTFFKVSPVFLSLESKMFSTWVGFSVAG